MSPAESRTRRAWALGVLFLPVLLTAVTGHWIPALVLAQAAVSVAVLAPVDRLGGVARAVVLRALPAAVGWIVIVVALDWTAGAVWNRLTDTTTAPPVDTPELADTDLPPSDDPRAHVPAYDGEPWVDRYFSELDALRYGYVPFIGPRVSTVRGRYINSSDGIRRSYLPPGAETDDAVEVWFFGGSTTWGEGQRDLHTVPSEVARLAEEDGLLIRPVNMGERGYTAFQEFLLFQQRLDEMGPPDLAVFHDGHNELGTRHQAELDPSEHPTIFQLDTTADALERVPPLRGHVPLPEPSVRRHYADRSLLNRLLREISALGTASPAGAQAGQPADDVIVADDIGTAFRVYRRSVALIRELAERRDVPVELFWQPFPVGSGLIADLDGLLPEGVHDIQDGFVGGPPEEEILIDGGHANELGARLGAEAIWEHLGPAILRLADQ